MIQELNIHFLQSISTDIPIVKLTKYRNYILKNKQLAKQIWEKMQVIALENKYIGEIDAMCDMFKDHNKQKPEQYRALRDQFVSERNRLKGDESQLQSVDNDEVIMIYKKLAQLFSKNGYHQQSAEHYKKIFRKRTQKIQIKKQQYFDQWVKQLFYSLEYNDLNTFLHCPLEKSVSKKLINLALGMDIKRILIKNQRVFEHILQSEVLEERITRNEVISIQDLGFLYSIYALANQSREFLKKNTKWSSKIQNYYLHGEYLTFFNQFNKLKNTCCFNPVIQKILDQCEQKINERVIIEVLSSYKKISFQKITKLTLFRQGIIKQFLLKNPKLPFLIDVKSSSVVQVQHTINDTFHEQVKLYNKFIEQKFNEKLNASLCDESLFGLGKKRSGQMSWHFERGQNSDSD